MRRGSKVTWWIVAIVLLVLWRQYGPGLPAETLRSDSAIAQAFAERRSGVMVEVSGRAERLLPGASKETEIQRFILELGNGHILLIEHDLNQSDEVPLEQWDPVSVRGEYEWTAQGGRVVSTQRDPGIGLRHGWIEFKGKRYD